MIQVFLIFTHSKLYTRIRLSFNLKKIFNWLRSILGFIGIVLEMVLLYITNVAHKEKLKPLILRFLNIKRKR